MSTIAQEITRIQGGVNDVWDYCEDNGVIIPAGTTVDEARTYLDRIPHGGSENAFMTLTDLTGLFSYKTFDNQNEYKEGLTRFSQNAITNLYYAFYLSVDSNLNNSDILDKISQVAGKNTITDFRYAFNKFSNSNDAQYNKTLDLSALRVNGRANYGFQSLGNNYGILKLKLNSETFKNSTNVQYLFDALKNSVKLQLNTNELHLEKATGIQHLFSDTPNVSKITDYNGNDYNTINLYLRPNGCAGDSAFQNCGMFEYVNIIDNGAYINSVSNFTYNSQSLKGITGLDFSHISGTNIFAGNGSALTNFGELGIKNGTTIGLPTTVISDLVIKKIWVGNVNDIRDGQTIGYWYEKFANSIGTMTGTGTHRITINTTLYNSLTAAQIALITDKGYTLAHAA